MWRWENACRARHNERKQNTCKITSQAANEAQRLHSHADKNVTGLHRYTKSPAGLEPVHATTKWKTLHHRSYRTSTPVENRIDSWLCFTSSPAIIPCCMWNEDKPKERLLRTGAEYTPNHLKVPGGHSRPVSVNQRWITASLLLNPPHVQFNSSRQLEHGLYIFFGI